jgi:flagellar hook-basal body complex protein FliE
MQINSLNQLRATRPVDPFQQFSVEFNNALPATQGIEAPDATQGASFGEVLSNALSEVSNQEAKAEQTAFDFATGKPVDVHTMMIEMAKADVMVQVTSSVVSKTAQGINQLLQTQI